MLVFSSFVPSPAVLQKTELQSPDHFGLFLQPLEPANVNQSGGRGRKIRPVIVQKGRRGYHCCVDCFSERIESLETIKGFAYLESADPETLKKLLDVPNTPQEQRTVQDNEEEKNPKKIEVC